LHNPHKLIDAIRRYTRTVTTQLVTALGALLEAILLRACDVGRTITVEAPDAVTVLGHPDDLRDMLRNLLHNALVHGEGTVHVMVRRHTNGAGEEIVLEVEDEGDGVPAELREAVFDRFRKADANSPGAGLGLAIVRQVARDHGGDAQFVSDSHSRLTVTLPGEGVRPI
jgi:signal transduction histidine kinase